MGRINARHILIPAVPAYFSMFPDDVIASLISNVSNRPRHRHWQHYTDAQDVLNVLRSQSSLADVAKESFPALGMTTFFIFGV